MLTIGGETITGSLQGSTAAVLSGSAARRIGDPDTVGSMMVSGVAMIREGSTLRAGGSAIETAGANMSTGPNGLIFASDSKTSTAVMAQDLPTLIGTFVAGSRTTTAIVPDPSEIVIEKDMTLTSRDPAITIAGKTISFGSQGLEVAADGRTSIVVFTDSGSSPASNTDYPGATMITAGGQTWTAARDPQRTGEVSIDETTLSPNGAALTISNEVLSAASGGRLVVPDSSITTTIHLPAFVQQVGSSAAQETVATGVRFTSSDSVASAANIGTAVSSSTQSGGSRWTFKVHRVLLLAALMATLVLL